MSEFEHAEGFRAGEVAGGLALGPLETAYEELFADALEDGIITSEERAQLEKAADNLGLDRARLLKLEQAMMAAYEQRHRVKIVEHYEDAPASLAPIRVQAGADPEKALLLKRVEQLESRVKELEAELKEAQANINVEVDLSDLDDDVDDASEDPDEWWRRLRRDPTKPEPYRALYRIYRARDDVDRQFCVAQGLVALNEADAEQKATYEKHRLHGLMQAGSAISQAGWYDCLFHPEEEVLTGQIFGVIAPAVLIGRVTALRRDGKLHQPAPDTLQQPAESTVTSVRAMGWGAALLGLAAPPIYLGKDRDVAYEHIPAVPPCTVVGKRALSGPTQLEHAFMVGRHLSYYRQEHFVKTLFPSVPDLEDLFLSALTIGNPGLPIAADMKARVTPIAKAIEPLLESHHIDALRGHFLRFVEEGGRTNLQRWSAASEKTAARVGMALCGDLPTALGVLEPSEGKLGELGKDLLCFVTSTRYFNLRRQIGVAIA